MASQEFNKLVLERPAAVVVFFCWTYPRTPGNCEELEVNAPYPSCHANRPPRAFVRSLTHFDEFDLTRRTISDTETSGRMRITR